MSRTEVKPRFRSGLSLGDGAHRARQLGLHQHAELLVFDVGATARQVDVRIDQPGQDEMPFAIHLLEIPFTAKLPHRHDLAHVGAIHQDGHVAAGWLTESVDDGGMKKRVSVFKIHGETSPFARYLMTVRLTHDGALPPVASVCSFAVPAVASQGFSSVPGCQR